MMGQKELTLEEQYDVLTDEKFGHRVSMAFYQIAREVLNESTEIHGHDLRVNFARTILLANPTDFIKYGALLISDPQIKAINEQDHTKIDDESIIKGVRNMWNTLSGVSLA